MRYISYFFTGLVFLSCNNEPTGGIGDDSNPNVNASVYNDVNDLMDNLKSETQTFDVNDQTTPTSITGEGGTIINFDANAFTDSDGVLVTSGIVIHLDEYLSLSQMMKNNIQTLSNGQLLVTGGSFNLEATDANNAPLNVNPWSVNAQLPIQTDISGFENGMSLFVGEISTTDGIEQVNWTQATNNNEFWLSDGFMNFYGIDLGLSNCDVLYNMAGEEGTQFSVYIEDSIIPSNYMIWMFINDFPSVIAITSPTDDGLGVKTYDGSIPVGLNATLLAIGVDDDNYLRFGTLEIDVQEEDEFTIDVEYGTTENLTTLINQLGE
ncbi:MAG: hypothetical protein ACPGPB_05725 [Flavobacteriaceae bacterium]